MCLLLYSNKIPPFRTKCDERGHNSSLSINKHMLRNAFILVVIFIMLISLPVSHGVSIALNKVLHSCQLVEL